MLNNIAMVVCALLILTFGLSADAVTIASGAAGADGQKFCAPRVAKNFLRPIAKMTPIHRVPRSGRLTFAPKRLILDARPGRLIVGDGKVGFHFTDESVDQVRHLNWDVLTRLVKVDSTGSVMASVGSRRRRIRSIRGDHIKDFLFKVGPESGFYRVDITFRRIGNRSILGKFSNYIRVVRTWFDARLLPSTRVIHRGEIISARLANFGTETVASVVPDWRFTVQYFDGQNWVSAPGNPPPEKSKAIVRKLAAGKMDDCFRFHARTDEKPGLYRLTVAVDRSSKRGMNRTVQLTARFEIRGRSRM